MRRGYIPRRRDPERERRERLEDRILRKLVHGDWLECFLDYPLTTLMVLAERPRFLAALLLTMFSILEGASPA